MRPYFDSTPGFAGPANGPRLLLVSFHFPPGTAVGGVRWQKLAGFVAERGWLLDVVTIDPAVLASRDEGRLASLPLGVRAFGFTPPEPSLAALPRTIWRRLRASAPRKQAYTPVALSREDVSHDLPAHIRFARAYYAWLDLVEGRRLAAAAARVARALTKINRYAAVISSGPPHMAHEAARTVARAAHLPLVVDMRDPWSLVERVPKDAASPLWFALAEKAEARVVAEARLITMNTDRSTAAMRAKYPAEAARIITIRNGSDEEPLPQQRPSSRFTIRFAGTIYLDRDPRLVFRASKRVIDALHLEPRDFGLLFVGDAGEFGGKSLLEMAREEGIDGFVETHPKLPRSAAMEFLADGAMLLNLPQDSDMAIPAKVFEYVRFDAWLLILAHADSATAELLRGTDADVVDPDDVAAIAETIERRFRQFARGERPSAVGRDRRFDRRVQANMLLDRIAEISGLAPAAGNQAPSMTTSTPG